MDLSSKQFTETILMLGARQNGAVSRRQLLAAGLSRGGIRHRNENGRLFRIYRGSYSADGRHIDQKTIWMAGVLAAGEGSVLSHMSAAHAWGFGTSGATEVTRRSSPGRRVPAGDDAYERALGQAVKGRAARIPALKIHQTRHLDQSEVTVRFGIPITTVARTLVDICGLFGRQQLKALLHEAGRIGLLRFDEIRHEIERSKGKKGVALLREIIDNWDPQIALTRNRLESRMFSLCRRYGIPKPEVNRKVAGYEVDFFWPDVGLVVETDGAQDHAAPYGFERDRNKDSDLQINGLVVLRLTWEMLTREPERSMDKVKAHRELAARRQVPAVGAPSAPKAQSPG